MIGTKVGAYGLQGEEWISVYQGMVARGVNDLILNSDDVLYAATESGIYTLPANNFNRNKENETVHIEDNVYQEGEPGSL